MARPAKPGGLVALCAKHGISTAAVISALDAELKERTLWDWTKTKPTALEYLVLGIATSQKEIRKCQAYSLAVWRLGQS